MGDQLTESLQKKTIRPPPPPSPVHEESTSLPLLQAKSQLFSPYIDGYVPEEPNIPKIELVESGDTPKSDHIPDTEALLPATSNPLEAQELTLVRGADGGLYGLHAAQQQPPPPEHSSSSNKSQADKRSPLDVAEAAAKEGRRRDRESEQSTGITLSPSEMKRVEKLRQKDQQVRMHEMAHAASAGPYVMGAPVYSYQVGPDGRQYAVGGHVNIDTSPAPTPEETVIKMQVIRGASVSPNRPSVKDVQVASHAMMTEMKARSELVEDYYTPLSESLNDSIAEPRLRPADSPEFTRSRLSSESLKSAEGLIMKPEATPSGKVESTYYPFGRKASETSA
ncbi:hypothetical protein BVX99_02685 [bacterium F16]|nr:hypothetical protein BVX99_02685 [bacterium F16]